MVQRNHTALPLTQLLPYLGLTTAMLEEGPQGEEETHGLLRLGDRDGLSAATDEGQDPGLSAEQARALREVHGYNLIPPPTSLPPWLCCLIPCLRQSKARRYYDICVPDDCSVRREGRWLTIDALGVVVGDTVRLLPGHRAAADIRLLQVKPCCPFRPVTVH